MTPLDKIIEGRRLISEGLAEMHGEGTGRAGNEDSGTVSSGGQGADESSPKLHTASYPRPDSLEGNLGTLKWRKGDRGSEYLPLKDVPQSILNQFQIGLGKTIGTKSYWKSDKYLSRRDAK